MRKGELLGLKWDDFDLSLRTVTIQRTLAEPRGSREGGDVRPFFNEPKTEQSPKIIELPKETPKYRTPKP